MLRVWAGAVVNCRNSEGIERGGLVLKMREVGLGQSSWSSAQLHPSSNEKIHLLNEVPAAACLFLLLPRTEPVNNNLSTPIHPG